MGVFRDSGLVVVRWRGNEFGLLMGVWVYFSIAVLYLLAVWAHCRYLRIYKPDSWEAIERFDPFFRNTLSGGGRYLSYLVFEKKSKGEIPYLLVIFGLLVLGLYTFFSGYTSIA